MQPMKCTPVEPVSHLPCNLCSESHTVFLPYTLYLLQRVSPVRPHMLGIESCVQINDLLLALQASVHRLQQLYTVRPKRPRLLPHLHLHSVDWVVLLQNQMQHRARGVTLRAMQLLSGSVTRLKPGSETRLMH